MSCGHCGGGITGDAMAAGSNRLKENQVFEILIGGDAGRTRYQTLQMWRWWVSVD
jgi:hypothetical protein